MKSSSASQELSNESETCGLTKMNHFGGEVASKSGFFLVVQPKTQGEKLKLKQFFLKTQAVFSKNLKKPEIFQNFIDSLY